MCIVGIQDSPGDLYTMSDNILWGAEQIGREANIVDENGNVHLPKTFRLLEQGRLPGKKVGRLWTSTKEQSATTSKSRREWFSATA